MLGFLVDIKIPLGFQLLRWLPFPQLTRERKLFLHRIFILVLTFAAYVCYHASRKPISVVKNELIKCPEIFGNETEPVVCSSWITELDGATRDDAVRLEGVLDSVYLFSYAFFMFFSGIIAERVNLRYFLSLGMIMSGVFTFLFGLAKYTNIRALAYFIAIQFFAGAFQTTGWPSVVTVVANWFGKAKKGLIFGIWNSHTNVGNILGSTMAGAYVSENWGMSFIGPGILVAGCGFLVWLTMIVKPEDVGIELENTEATTTEPQQADRLYRAQSHPRSSNHSHASGELTPLLQSDESEDDNEMGMEGKTPPDVSSPGEGSSSDPPELARSNSSEEKAISFIAALKIPGVLEFSFCLFFAKLVSYVFLFWLPGLLAEKGDHLSSEFAAYFSTLFDVGGIIGGIVAGLATDMTGKSASTCAVMLIGAIPMLFAYQGYENTCQLNEQVQDSCYYGHIGFLLAIGFLVNGPYALITTAVSADLGTHPSLQGSSKALATVTSVIDGTGSIGAAVGPLLAAEIGLDKTFYMLMAADVLALILLVRLVKKDIEKIIDSRRQRRRGELYARQP